MNFFALAKLVKGAAVLAFGRTGLDNFDVDARMHAPQRRLGARTKQREVLGAYIDHISFGFFFRRAAHADSYNRGCCWLGKSLNPLLYQLAYSE